MSAASPAQSQMMPEPQAAALLQGRGIDYVGHEFVATAQEAAAAAARIGFPVVLKVVSADVVHKSDAGGVLLGLSDAEAVRAGFERLVTTVADRVPGARIDGVLVCRQVSGAGAELIVGAVRDGTFGPTVMIGAGGVFAEVLGDVAFRLAPICEDDALEMLRELRAFKTLTGFRNVPPLDIAALAQVAVRLGDVLVDHPEISEVDLNPVLALPQGCIVVDARIMTATSAAVIGDWGGDSHAAAP
jgi:acyl-CoA synthetase (NDP forming)